MYPSLEENLAPYEEEITKGPKSNSNWKMGGDLAPVYAYRTASDKPNISNSLNSDYNTTNERGLFTYSGGVNLGYELNEKFTIQSGIYYAQIGQIADEVNLKQQPEFAPPVYSSNDPKYTGNTSAGKLNADDKALEEGNKETNFYDDENIAVDNLEQNFQYIEVPLIAKYKILDKKLDLQLIGGLNTGLLVGNDLYKKNGFEKDRVGETENISKYIYNTITGIGLGYELSDKLFMSVEPTIKYSLTSINKAHNYHYRPYSFGVFTGISYRFK